MGPLTQTVKSIVSETHIYQSKQWETNCGKPLTQTVKSIVSETHIYYTNCKVYCFRNNG